MSALFRVIAVVLMVNAAIRAESPNDISFNALSQFSAESCNNEMEREEPLVGKLGDPADIQFEGLERLTAKELRNSLSLDLDYQAAARPSSSLSKLMSALEARLVAGLRHSGFMKSTVATTYNAEKNAIVVSIAEGAQFRNGPIRIDGAEEIDGSLIAQQLAQTGKAQSWTYFFGENRTGAYADDHVAEATWKKEEVTRSDEDAMERLTMRIRHLMIEQGFPFATFTVAVEPETAETAGLVVRIANEGAQGVLTDSLLKLSVQVQS